MPQYSSEQLKSLTSHQKQDLIEKVTSAYVLERFEYYDITYELDQFLANLPRTQIEYYSVLNIADKIRASLERGRGLQ